MCTCGICRRCRNREAVKKFRANNPSRKWGNLEHRMAYQRRYRKSLKITDDDMDRRALALMQQEGLQ